MNKRPLCVGLTGGIGSGKSTVAHLFAALGAAVIDADVIAREVTLPGARGFAAILAHFSPGVLTAAGELDRSALRRIIFQDPAAKGWLEQTLHPLILEVIGQRIAHVSTPYCIIVIPLLAETPLPMDFLDRICVVDAPEALRVQWAAQRDEVAPTEIAAIITTQASRENRLAIADDIITNDRDLAALQAQVAKLDRQYRETINRCPRLRK